jgi:hypothetical protein
MPIESVLILVVVTIFILWAFKKGYIKALWKGYVFSFAHGTAEDGSFVPVLKLEQGWKFRKFVAASPIIGYIPISRENVSYFLSTNREGYGQRLIPLMKAMQQWEQNVYNAENEQQTRNAYWQTAEQIQEELEKVDRRVTSSGAAEGAGGVLALRDVRENRAKFDTTLTLLSAIHLGMAAQDLGLLSRSAYENFLDSCEGMDKENTVLMDESVRQEIMKYVDNPKQEKKLRRRKKWASFWEYPLDSQWAWGKSLKLKG